MIALTTPHMATPKSGKSEPRVFRADFCDRTFISTSFLASHAYVHYLTAGERKVAELLDLEEM